MEGRYGRGKAKFFLPIGDVESLEDEVFFLMELQGETYDSAMRIPWSRRKRFVEKKSKIEANKREAQKQANNRQRSLARRRR